MLNSLVVKSMIKKEIETEGIPDTEARKEIGDHTGNTNNPHNVTKVQVGLEKVDNTSDVDKPVSKEQQKAIDSAKNNANEYTDQKIADLINGAPTTLDTLKEIADAMEENQDVVKALDESIGTKANSSDLTDHIGNTNNPHSVTKEQLGLGDVVESEVATDFSEAETPKFQQTIDDVLDGVNELKSDLVDYKETEATQKNVYLDSNILLDYVSLTINSGNGGYSVSKQIDIKDVSSGDVLYIHCGEVTNGISDRKFTALAYDENGSWIGNGGYIASNKSDFIYALPDGTVGVKVTLLLSRNYPIDANVNVTFNDLHIFKNSNSRDIFVKDSALPPIRTTSTHFVYKMPYLNWEKGIFNKATGKVDGTAYYHAKLDVKEGEIYHIKGYSWLSIHPCIFADNDDHVISFYPTTESSSKTLEDFEIVVPKGATRLYCNAILNYQDGSIGQWDMFNCIVKQKILTDEYAHSKHLIVLGDSWCEKNITANENFTDYLINDGYEVTNLGIGGTGYRRTYDTNNAFYQRALNLPTDKGNNVLIFGSFNDLGLSDYTLGDIDSTDLTTICGCINQTISNIYSVLPLANIIVATPGSWRYRNRKESDKDKAEAYCNAIVNICKKNQIPVYNFYDDCGLRAWDSAFCNEFYKEGWATDTTHPNDKGHFYYVYPKIRDFVIKHCN